MSVRVIPKREVRSFMTADFVASLIDVLAMNVCILSHAEHGPQSWAIPAHVKFCVQPTIEQQFANSEVTLTDLQQSPIYVLPGDPAAPPGRLSHGTWSVSGQKQQFSKQPSSGVP